MRPDEVWIADDDRSIRFVLERAFSQANIPAQVFPDGDALLAALATGRPQAIVSDVRMPGTDGLALIKAVHQEHPELPIIIMTAHSDLDSAVNAYQGGAFEYLPKPFDVDDVVATVQRAIEAAQEQAIAAPAPANTAEDQEIIGQAPAMQEVFRAIGRLATSNITVLITGESGSGKELVAQALHRHSPRASEPFVALNMAAIPHDLVESELFGHEKGAFTGATASRVGRFEQADGGTLFLDEIGDMPADTQTRLLRVLADGQFYRVGGHSPISVDVRIIAATHQDLESLVQLGRFREDLYHRLNVIRVHVPSLKDRRVDIPILAQHFLAVAAEELGAETKVLTLEAERYLCALPWPGNVRQLVNTCRWLTVMAPGRDVSVGDLPPELRDDTQTDNSAIGDWRGALRTWADEQLARSNTPLLDHAMPEFEQVMIDAALAHSGGHKRDASLLLGWGRNTLTRKMKELEDRGEAS